LDADAGILSGLTVVEVSSTLPSAHVGQLLADFGAEVVHVEPPGGSPLRSQPAFPFWDRGKKSIELDLQNPDDRDVAAVLAEHADVLVESFRPGVADRLGLGFERLHVANSRLVYASITGFPSSGPNADLHGYEALVVAKIGGFHAFAPAVARPGPAFASVPYCSFSAAQTALQGILAALYEREQSGLGQRVETSLLQAVASLDPWNWMLHVVTSRFPDAYTAAPPFTSDGSPNTPFTYMLLVALTDDGRWLQFSQVQPHLYRALMRALDLEWMFDDPEWAGLPVLQTPQKRIELWDRMLRAVQTRTLAEWQELFERDHNVWAEVFRSGSELLDHPQMVHDRQVVEITDPERGQVRQPGPMFRLSGSPGRADRPAPRRDEDGGELRSRAGVSKPDPAALVEPAGSTGLPLAGVTVLELGTFYAGPFGATVLTDLGARVIKVEPIEGDPMRTILPFPETGAARVLQGKESVAVDLETDECCEIIYELARRSDLVLQTFRAGVAARHRVDAETLRSINPNIVYVNAPGYGVDGPCGDRPAYAPTIGAGAGVARRNASDTVTERPGMTIDEIKEMSVRLIGTNTVAFAQTDGLAALGVGTALLLGLVGRARGFGGQTILSTMLSTVAHALSEQMVEYEGRPDLIQVDDAMLGYGPLYRLYEAADRSWVFLAAPQDKEWGRLAAALAGYVDIGGDPRFATPDERRRSAAELAEVLAGMFGKRPAQEWEKDLVAAGVGCVVVTEQSPEAVLLGDFGRASGVLADISHPTFDEYARLGPLVRFSRSATVAKRGCLLGEHTETVLGELGYSNERIAHLRASKVIA
jgi:crotonobetainyl-CoA:carnitine CoA-transferase CaiB-like acyl-CoA transferase